MTYTLYDGTIVVLRDILKSLSHILHKAEKSHDAATLLAARLHPDMYALPDQIRLATQYSENSVARLSGREAVTFEEPLTSFEGFYERIEKVMKTLEGAEKEVVNRCGEESGLTRLSPQYEVMMSGATYVHTIALPNVYFHLGTAYGILRKEGVPLGKFDYYNGFIPQ